MEEVKKIKVRNRMTKEDVELKLTQSTYDNIYEKDIDIDNLKKYIVDAIELLANDKFYHECGKDMLKKSNYVAWVAEGIIHKCLDKYNNVDVQDVLQKMDEAMEQISSSQILTKLGYIPDGVISGGIIDGIKKYENSSDSDAQKLYNEQLKSLQEADDDQMVGFGFRDPMTKTIFTIRCLAGSIKKIMDISLEGVEKDPVESGKDIAGKVFSISVENDIKNYGIMNLLQFIIFGTFQIHDNAIMYFFKEDEPLIYEFFEFLKSFCMELNGMIHDIPIFGEKESHIYFSYVKYIVEGLTGKFKDGLKSLEKDKEGLKSLEKDKEEIKPEKKKEKRKLKGYKFKSKYLKKKLPDLAYKFDKPLIKNLTETISAMVDNKISVYRTEELIYGKYIQQFEETNNKNVIIPCALAELSILMFLDQTAADAYNLSPEYAEMIHDIYSEIAYNADLELEYNIATIEKSQSRMIATAVKMYKKSQHNRLLDFRKKQLKEKEESNND